MTKITLISQRDFLLPPSMREGERFAVEGVLHIYAFVFCIFDRNVILCKAKNLLVLNITKIQIPIANYMQTVLKLICDTIK